MVSSAAIPATAISVISVLIAITALALTLYQQFYRVPKLSLSLNLDPSRGDLLTLAPEAERGEIRERDATEHWVQLRVTNAKGKHSATDVEVLYIGRRTNGNLSVLPRQLRYSATAENPDHRDILAIGSGKPDLRTTVPAGVFRYVEFISASASESVQMRLRAKPRLAIWPGPPLLLEEGQHEIYLAVASRDTDAVFYRVGLRTKYGWTDDPSEWWTTHVVLSPLERLRDSELETLLA